VGTVRSTVVLTETEYTVSSVPLVIRAVLSAFRLFRAFKSVLKVSDFGFFSATLCLNILFPLQKRMFVTVQVDKLEVF
jgi:hypothetical protein